MKKLFYCTMILIVVAGSAIAKSKRIPIKWDRNLFLNAHLQRFAKQNPTEYAGKNYLKYLSDVHILNPDGTGKWKDSATRVKIQYDMTKKTYNGMQSYDLETDKTGKIRTNSTNFAKFEYNDGYDETESDFNGFAPKITKDQYLVGSKWVDSANQALTLDAKNRVTYHTYSYYVDGKYAEWYRDRFLYDSKDMFAGVLSEEYDDVKKTWVASSGTQVSYTYDSKGNITSGTVSEYDASNQKFFVVEKETYFLNTDGSISAAIKWDFDTQLLEFVKRDSISNIEWLVFDKKRARIFDGPVLKAGGLLTKKFIINIYDQDLKVWNPAERYEYFYNSSNKLTKAEIATYSFDSVRFIVDQIDLVDYYPNNDIKYKESATKKNGLFTVNSITRYINTYLANGDISTSYTTYETTSLQYSPKLYYFYEGNISIGVQDFGLQNFTTKYFPNPTDNKLVIESDKEDLSKIQILGMDGKLIQTIVQMGTDVHAIQLSLENLTSGTYILKNAGTFPRVIGKFNKI